jgi:hypothetical protein
MHLDTSGFRYKDPETGRIYTIPNKAASWREYLCSLQYAGHEGIKAIKFLQSLPGIRESTWDALQGWRIMMPVEQRWTIDLAKRLGMT